MQHQVTSSSTQGQGQVSAAISRRLALTSAAIRPAGRIKAKTGSGGNSKEYDSYYENRA
ncbi:hypothetical protein [Ktedonobacter racemifer]|nr:hypothetical protein [Ktedonobacter racemifer]